MYHDARPSECQIMCIRLEVTVNTRTDEKNWSMYGVNGWRLELSTSRIQDQSVTFTPNSPSYTLRKKHNSYNGSSKHLANQFISELVGAPLLPDFTLSSHLASTTLSQSDIVYSPKHTRAVPLCTPSSSTLIHEFATGDSTSAAISDITNNAVFSTQTH